MEQPRYRQNQEKSDQKRDKAREKSDRDQIIASLQRISDQAKTTEHHANRAERYHRLVEKLTKRFEFKRFWVDSIGVFGIYIAAGVAAWAVIDSHSSSDKQYFAMVAQQRTMQGQLDSMEAQQRPWVSLDVEMADALAYDAAGWDAGTRWHSTLRYQIKNVGRTPADKVSVFTEIIPLTISHFPLGTIIKDGIPQSIAMQGTEADKEISRVCDFPEKMSALKMGFDEIVFPDEQRTRSFGLNGNPSVFDEAKNPNSGYAGQFLVVVCVTYRSTSNAKPYGTGKAFNLFKRTGNGNIDLNGETIALSDLGFVLFPLNGSYVQ